MFRKVLVLLMTLGLVLMGFAAETGVMPAERSEESAAPQAAEIVLQIGSPVMLADGRETPIDAQGTAPVIVNDRTLLPVRAVVEAIGGKVGWKSDTEEVTLSYGGEEIILVIGSLTAKLNGEETLLDVAPVIMNDRTMLPIRFIAESFGFTVDWDGETEKVTIRKAAGGAEQTESDGTDAIIREGTFSTDLPDDEPERDDAGKHTAVVYFSATGNTKALAEKFAKAAGADLIELVPEEPYSAADLNYNGDCRANREQNDDTARPGIASKIENFDGYDTVIIGHPIWWGTIPRIICTFMDEYDLAGKTVYMFCTSGSSGIATAVRDVRNYAPDADVVAGMRGTAATTAEEIETWLADNGFAG